MIQEKQRETSRTIDCVVVAGGRPGPEDPLFPYTQGRPKALLDVAGRPLVDHVLQALLGARRVGQIEVVGLDSPPQDGYGPDVAFLPDQGGMIANGLAGLSRIKQRRPDTRHVLFASADIPAATGPMIDDVLDQCRLLQVAAYYFMVERQAMESVYPGSKRTYTRLRDMEVAGVDIAIADARLAEDNSGLLEDASASRKRPWKMARIAGLTTLLALLTRRLTLEGIGRRASRVLGAPVSVSLVDYPQLAMDVDRPEQLLLLRDLLQ
jgi:molybdopterin-guanine dinucleotide biosynthesis protein A